MNALQSYSSDNESEEEHVGLTKKMNKPPDPGTNYDNVGMDISEDSCDNADSEREEPRRRKKVPDVETSTTKQPSKSHSSPTRSYSNQENGSRKSDSSRETEKKDHHDRHRESSDNKSSKHDRHSKHSSSGSSRREREKSRERSRRDSLSSSSSRDDKDSRRSHDSGSRDHRRDGRGSSDRRPSTTKRSRSKSRERDRKKRRSRSRSREREREKEREKERDRRKPHEIRKDAQQKLAAFKASNPDFDQSELLKRGMAAQFAEVQRNTGVTLPSYYNPATMNPAKIAEQERKKKLLWGNKSKVESSAPVAAVAPAGPSTGIWENTTFTNDSDGKMAEKFKRLMGVKATGPTGPAVAAQRSSLNPPVGKDSSEILEKQETLFNSMETQYERARLATHTQRGFGLGFSSQTYLPKP